VVITNRRSAVHLLSIRVTFPTCLIDLGNQ
jgi:hypothetical protein